MLYKHNKSDLKILFNGVLFLIHPRFVFDYYFAVSQLKPDCLSRCRSGMFQHPLITPSCRPELVSGSAPPRTGRGSRYKIGMTLRFVLIPRQVGAGCVIRIFHFLTFSLSHSHFHFLVFSPYHPLTLSPSHLLTFSPSHPLTLSPSHLLPIVQSPVFRLPSTKSSYSH